MKIPEIILDLSVRKRSVPTEDARNTKYFKRSFPSVPALSCSWQPVGGSEILKVHFTVVLSMGINKNSRSP